MARGRKINPLCVVGAVVIVGILLFSLSGTLGMFFSEETTSGSMYSATLTAYSDGKPVQEPLIMGSFTEGGVSIDSIVVDVWWTSMGDSIDWTTFSLVGVLNVYCLDGQGNWFLEHTASLTSVEADGSWSQTTNLGTDICRAENIYYDGWELKFELTLTGTVKDTIGQIWDDVIVFEGHTNIIYASGFNMDGGWSPY